MDNRVSLEKRGLAAGNLARGDAAKVIAEQLLELVE